MTDKTLQLLGRGSSDQNVHADNNLCIAKWMDNKTFYLASSVSGVKEEDNCKRWSRKIKKYIKVKQPEILRQYNNKMGVDMIDRTTFYYSAKARTKKWTVKVIIHILDLSAANAWLQYWQDRCSLRDRKREVLEYIDFKVELAHALIAGRKIERQTARQSSDGSK
ncbi:PiggyBac transposable element-derived protein 3 [Acipenser ruthenus]|uniref:PiggyBac transposable element-derived protein 3 n=1 Tax=Acipenser ruthenus TaxID=7906 RepID=A0A444U0X0_ACIRT|nr:PiggyBac transposable element-derived protein 3 [Acipenser ruthenus]